MLPPLKDSTSTSKTNIIIIILKERYKKRTINATVIFHFHMVSFLSFCPITIVCIDVANCDLVHDL